MAQIALLKLGERRDVCNGFEKWGRAIGGLMRCRRSPEHEVELPGIVQNNRPFNLIFEFAHIAGPVVFAQAALLFRGERQGVLVVAPGEVLDEGLYQAGDVLLAFAQGRDGQGDDGDAVQQVFAESPFPDFFPQIAVGRGHEPEPGRISRVPPRRMKR